MRELALIEAKVPSRPAVARVEQPALLGRLMSGPIFSRARDIFAANMAELLDRAEDPARMIRMIILEMEETLVELRATAARSIADLKDLEQSVRRLDEIGAGWNEKAELALAHDREDLARAALGEKQQAERLAAELSAEMAAIEQVLKSYEDDIRKLQSKLAEARSRQMAISNRIAVAVVRARTNEVLHSGRSSEAFASFEQLEREADFAEGRADALALAAPVSLEEEIAGRKAAEKIDAELAAMRAARAAREDSAARATSEDPAARAADEQ